MLIVYNQSGQTVGTNVYGREIAVDSSGQVIDFRNYDVQEKLAVPDKGIVVSAHVDGLTGANRFVMNSMDGYVGIDYTTNCVYHYNTENGYLAHHKAVADGEKYGKLPVPTREGYIFDSWYTAKEGGEKITAKSAYSTSTLYAHWKKNITFDANEGELDTAVESCQISEYNNYEVFIDNEQEIALAPVGLYVYTEAGAAIGVASSSNSIVVNEHGMVIQFRGKNDNSILTVPQGGYVIVGYEDQFASMFGRKNAFGFVANCQNSFVGIDDVTNVVYRYENENAYLAHHKTAADGESYGKLPVPIREGYTFDGWYTAKVGGMKISEMSLYSTPVLYAHWAKNAQISFVEKPVLSNGKVSVQIAKAITEPSEINFVVVCYDVNGKMIGVTMVTQTVNGNTASVILDYPEGMSSEDAASWNVLLLDTESFSPMCQNVSSKR